MNRSDSRLPSQLRVVGATDLERRLLEASARELPSVELTRKMQQALGISIAAGAVTAATAKAAAAGAGSAAPAFAWPVISVGVLALAVTGAVVGVGVGVHTTASHRAIKAAASTAMLVPAPAVTVAPPAPSFAPAAVEVAAPVARRRAPAAPAHHRAALAAAATDLRGEIALVDAARTAVAAGSNERALTLLERYDVSHPHGTFRPEVAALRIEALDRLGRTAQARALAQKFVVAHPDSPLAERVARVTGLAVR